MDVGGPAKEKAKSLAREVNSLIRNNTGSFDRATSGSHEPPNHFVSIGDTHITYLWLYSGVKKTSTSHNNSIMFSVGERCRLAMPVGEGNRDMQCDHPSTTIGLESRLEEVAIEYEGCTLPMTVVVDHPSCRSLHSDDGSLCDPPSLDGSGGLDEYTILGVMEQLQVW
jgi:hypothetical protein